MKTSRWMAVFLGLGALAGAQGRAAPGAVGTWTVTTTAASQYLFRGVRLSGPSLQPMAEYDQGDLAVGLWSSVPLRDKVPGQSDPEIDPYGSYRIPFGDALSVQPGFTLYSFPRAEPRNGFYRLTFEPNVAFNYTSHGVTLTPKVYYDVVLRGPTYELNAAYALPVREIGSELDFYASIGTYEWNSAVAHAEPDTKGRGDYWSATMALPFQVSTKSKVIASVGYAKGWNNWFKQDAQPKVTNSAAVGRFIVTLGYAYTF